MEYFFYARDAPGVGELRWALHEEHWSFMDAYDDQFIARGPTLTDDGSAPTGSVHIVDLPSAEAVRVFAFDEPNYRAGVYESILIRRFRNSVGRTMWEYAGGSSGFLVLGHGRPQPAPVPPIEVDGLIVGGSLLSDDGTEWVGTALLVERPDRAAAERILDPAGYTSVEVHPWEFGGRR